MTRRKEYRCDCTYGNKNSGVPGRRRVMGMTRLKGLRNIRQMLVGDDYVYGSRLSKVGMPSQPHFSPSFRISWS